MPLVANQLLKYNGTKWTNSRAAISELLDVNLVTPTAGQALTYNGSNWTNNMISTTMQTNTTSTTLDLNSFTVNSFISYQASSITVSNGPSQIVNPVISGLVVLFETNSYFFTQTVYIRREAYIRSGILSDISTITWNDLYATSITGEYYEIIDGNTTPPISANDGDKYYVMPSPTDAWSSFSTGSIAVYDATNAMWNSVTLTDGRKVVLLSPDNLKSLSSQYYSEGIVYSYSPLVAAPVLTGVFLVSVGTTPVTSTTSQSLSTLKIKKLISQSMLRSGPTIGAQQYTLAVIGDNDLLYHNHATQNSMASNNLLVSSLTSSNCTFGKRLYRENLTTEKVKDVYISNQYNLTLLQDGTLIILYPTIVGNTGTTVVGQSFYIDVAAPPTTYLSSFSTILSKQVIQIICHRRFQEIVYSYISGATASNVTLTGPNFLYQKTNGKIISFGINGAMSGRNVWTKTTFGTYNLLCNFTAGSNIVTITNDQGTSELYGGEAITALTNYVPTNTFVGSILNGNQFTMITSTGTPSNATLSSGQTITINYSSGRVAGVFPLSGCATTIGSTTVNISSTSLCPGSRLYHSNFTGGMVTVVSVLTSTTVQVSAAATTTGSSLTIFVDPLTGQVKKIITVLPLHPFVIALTNNNNVLIWGSTNWGTINIIPTRYTTYFPGITDLVHAYAGYPGLIFSGGYTYSTPGEIGIWWKAGSVDGYSTWAGTGTGSGNGIGTVNRVSPLPNVFGSTGTVNTNPTNILVTRTVNSGAISIGVSTITTAANVTGMSAGFSVSCIGIPANSYVGSVLSATSFTIVNAAGVAVVTTQAIPSNTVISYKMLASGETIKQLESRFITRFLDASSNYSYSTINYILTSNNRLFILGEFLSPLSSPYFAAPTLFLTGVTQIHGYYSNAILLFTKDDGWLYGLSLEGSSTTTNLTLTASYTQYIPFKTIYNTATYGAIKECLDGYILTTNGDCYMFHPKGVIIRYNESSTLLAS